MIASPPSPPDSRPTASATRRWAPLAVLVAIMAVAFAMGWHKLLSWKTIGLNYQAMQAFVEAHLLAALASYIGAYIAVVALSLPGALIMTLAGGLLFGWQLGTVATVIGATVGATIIFLIAKTSFGEALAASAGPWLAKLRDGFRENALSYLLFLRLVPAFPFVIVNLAPALLGVPLRTYILGTALGIIPGTLAFSVAGASLGSIVEAQNAIHSDCLAKAGASGEDACPYTIDASAIITNELLLTFVLLGLLALIPAAFKTWSKRDAAK
jgi:uncharacterized membrane protein YdjX (TVP38/TMEM64 family)